MSPGLSDVECSLVLQSVLAISSTHLVAAFFLGTWHSSTHPVHHCMTRFYQAFPHISTTSDKINVGVRRPGYEGTVVQ